MNVDKILAEFDIDGPHDPDHTRAAAEAVAELVRYLNHATLPNRVGESLAHPADAAAVLHGLATALSRMPQLLHQVVGHLNRSRDRYGSDNGDPGGTVNEAVESAARSVPPIDQAAERIRRAAQAADRLYIQED